MKSIKKNVIIFGFLLILIIPLKPATYISPPRDGSIPRYAYIAAIATLAYGVGAFSSFLTRYSVSKKFNDDFSLLKKYEGYETNEKIRDNLKNGLKEKVNMNHANYSSLSRRHRDRPLLHYEELVSGKIKKLRFLKLFNLHNKEARKETNSLIAQLTKLKKIVMSTDRYWKERQSLKLRQ